MGLKGVFIKNGKAVFYKPSPLYFEPVPPSFRFAALGKKAQPIPGGANSKERIMAKWAVKDQGEFEARQSCFDFGAACRFVSSIALDVKKALTGYVSRLFKKAPVAVRKAHQLVLELNSIAQIPMVYGK